MRQILEQSNPDNNIKVSGIKKYHYFHFIAWIVLWKKCNIMEKWVIDAKSLKDSFDVRKA